MPAGEAPGLLDPDATSPSGPYRRLGQMLETRRLLLGVRCRFSHGYFADPVDAIEGARKARKGDGAPRGRAGGIEKPCSQRPVYWRPCWPGPLARRNGGLACGRRRCRAQVGGTAPSGPRLGGVQQRLSTPLRRCWGLTVLDPATKPVADRVELHVCAAEAEQLAALLGHQHSAALGLDRLCDRLPGVAGVPPGGTDPGGAKSHSYAASRASTSTSSASATAISAMDAPYIRRGPAPGRFALAFEAHNVPGDHEGPRDFFRPHNVDARTPGSLQALG